MPLDVAREMQSLRKMTVPDLQVRYAEAFGEAIRSRHKEFLVRRIAWRLQANADGGLTERARKRATEIADDRDLRMKAPAAKQEQPVGATVTGSLASDHNRRLPMPGAVLSREYRGRDVRVTVLANGFEHDGQVYSSLTAAVKAITGSHWNGYHFFRIAKQEGGDS